MITAVIPTVLGREEHLARCLDAYCETAPEVEILIMRGYESCSEAWNAGIAQIASEFIHLSADDLEPHPGWLEAAMATLENGHLPEARILNPDGSLFSCGADAVERPDGELVHFGRIPFFHRSLLEYVYPIFPGHYYGDVWISERARKHGIETAIARDYLFTHHVATAGRRDTLLADWGTYQSYVQVHF